jgi:hypothetical protein
MPRGDHWPHWTDRLEQKSKAVNNGCIEWTGSLNNRGYGVIWFDKKLRLAHRAAWFKHYGTWPATGMVLDHICNNKACINVAHLRELTNWQNVRRGRAIGDEATEARRENYRRTHLKYRGTYSPTYKVERA